MFLFKDGSIMIIIIVTYLKLNCADATRAGQGNESKLQPGCVPFIKTGQHIDVRGKLPLPDGQQPGTCCPSNQQLPMFQQFGEHIKNVRKAIFPPQDYSTQKKKKKDQKKSDTIIIVKTEKSPSRSKEQEEEEGSSSSSPNVIEAAVGAAVLATELSLAGGQASSSNSMQAPDSSKMIRCPSLTNFDSITSSNCSCCCLSCLNPTEDGWCDCNYCSNMLCVVCDLFENIDLTKLFSPGEDDS